MIIQEFFSNRNLYANANPIGYKDPSGHTSVAEQACATAIMAVVSQRYTICLAGLMGAIFGAAVSPLLKGNANAEDHMLKSMISGFIMGAGISAIGFIAAAVFSISLIHFYITVALISTTTEFVEAVYCLSQGKTKESFVHMALSLISFVGFSKLYNMPDVFPSMEKGLISKYANAVEDRGAVPGRVQSRINVATGPTRFTPLRNPGEQSKAGFEHVLDEHFDRDLANSRSVFSITPDELKIILQSKQTVDSPVIPTGDGRYVRIVDTGKVVGNTALKFGGGETTWIKIFTDKAGNLITTFPVPEPNHN